MTVIRSIDKTQPTALRQLVALVGSNVEAGRMIGLSDSAVSVAFAKNECRVAFEMAARYQLSKLTKESAPKVKRLAIINVPNEHLQAVEALVKALGGTFNIISLENA